MPPVQADRLTRIAAAMLRAAGATWDKSKALATGYRLAAEFDLK